jgi:hypothetical protein
MIAHDFRAVREVDEALLLKSQVIELDTLHGGIHTHLEVSGKVIPADRDGDVSQTLEASAAQLEQGGFRYHKDLLEHLAGRLHRKTATEIDFISINIYKRNANAYDQIKVLSFDSGE